MTLHALQVAAIAAAVAATATGVALFARAVLLIARVIRLGRPDPTRTDYAGARTASLFREFLGHTRMARLPVVAAAHWLVMVAFGVLFVSLATAYGQLFDPRFALPWIGRLLPVEWLVEGIAWLSLIGILVLIGIRQRLHPKRLAVAARRQSRFYGSTVWQAYYVEATIVGVVVCALAIRALEYALVGGGLLHHPLTAWLGRPLDGVSTSALEKAIVAVAAAKILISMAWFITIGLTPTMGVAWHRFLAFFNVWFKRHPGRADAARGAAAGTSLGALAPIRVDGAVVNLAHADDLDPDAVLGVGAVEDFTWKGLLDLSTCTECGRCQAQCPAWHTDKPLSPSFLVLGLRDHAYAKAPWLLASPEEQAEMPDAAAEAARPFVALGGVVDPDVLWSCTTCGACVEACPVDIEHVDHIVDIRRNQVLMESAFPSQLGGLFKSMERSANPWGASPRTRMDWAKGLEFDVPIVGTDVESMAGVEYLFWVGCAGAFEDRARRTTRAVAELLHTAGVSFAVLGEAESCTGDPARRAGNEFLFATLAAANVEVLNEVSARKIVVTCAHCFNTLRNEYPQLGGRYDVVHHTQLLNRLVREGRLTPVTPPSRSAVVTYHDPCYLGRHNGVYSPPRELISALPGLRLAEMPRHGSRSFCCGAGGARMWMEEKIGTRINTARTAEAVATGAGQIAVGCPFCRVMLGDGLTSAQAEGTAGDDVEVVDVAEMLLAAVRVR